MNPIMDKFEDWYAECLTPRQREVMLEFSGENYKHMATRLAYDAFKAGYKANKTTGE